MLNRLKAALHVHKSRLYSNYFFILSILVESEVKVENGFFEKFGEIYFLSVFTVIYLYSLTITVSEFFTEMVSVSPRDPSFLERGGLRIATRILGCSIFKILIITTKLNNYKQSDPTCLITRDIDPGFYFFINFLLLLTQNKNNYFNVAV